MKIGNIEVGLRGWSPLADNIVRFRGLSPPKPYALILSFKWYAASNFIMMNFALFHDY